MKADKILKFTFWKTAAVIIVAVGVYSTYLRFTKGLGAVTNLGDSVPWGLWIAFDFLGVGLSAAGFTIAAAVHVFNIEKFKPLVRPAVLTAYLGYLLVVMLLVVDLGRPDNFWHPLVMWNHHSVMLEITWCIICYTTVLSLEFAPVIFEKFKLSTPARLLKKISIPVVIAGVILSTLHQSSFGSLYLIVPGRLHPLWYSSILPINFFISCLAAGLSMIIFESFLINRALGKSIRTDLLSRTAKWVMIILIAEFVVRMSDIIISGRAAYIFSSSYETYMFWLEMIVGIFIPIVLLSKKRGDKLILYLSSILVICGFILNRFNVSITGVERSAGASYFPSFDEISITMMLLVLAMFVFKKAAEYLPVFEPDKFSPRVPDTERKLHENKIILSE